MPPHPNHASSVLATTVSVTRDTLPARPDSAATIPYELPLRRLLPNGERALLLAACLREPTAAARAWADFVALVGDARTYFEEDSTGLQSMLPFIEASLTRNGIDAGTEFHRYARNALIREQAHSRLYREILAEVLGALEAAAIPVLLLQAAAVSAMVYPQPSLRHNEAIDLLVHPNQMNGAVEALQTCGFEPVPRGAGAAAHGDFRHISGIALGLHSRLFLLPHFELSAAEVRQRRRYIQLRDRSCLSISPADCLLHICGDSLYSRRRPSLLWVCDAFHLLQQSPDLNWRQLVETAVRARLALPLLVLLSWMRDFLGVAIPLGYLTELEANSREVDAVTAEGICASLLHSMHSRRKSFGMLAGDPRQAWAFLKFSMLPSARYRHWKHNLDEPDRRERV